MWQLLLLALLALPVVLMLGAAYGPVERGRVERFARRHQLPITVSNGAQVIRYLAVTRRWRVAGLILGYLTIMLWQWPFHDGFTVYFLALFAGWFAGALVAELRLVTAPDGIMRTAVIAPRDPYRYMNRLGWWLLPAIGGVNVTLAVATVYFAVVGRPIRAVEAALTAVAALLVVAGTMLIRRRVLLRPQRVLPADQLAADNALRSRSVHVLTGAGVALALYVAWWQLDAIAGDTPLLLLLINLVAPVLGLSIATTNWPLSRPAPPQTAPRVS